MSDSRRPRAVLDADIIYSRVLHELIGRVAAEMQLLDLFYRHPAIDPGDFRRRL